MADISKHDINNFKKIYNFFKDKCMPDNGIYGLIGNLYVESGLRSNNLQNTYNTKFGLSDEEYTNGVNNGTISNFATDKAGYGIAQWTSSGRKQGLLNYLTSGGLSIDNLDGQIEYLWYEIKTAYKSVYNVLMDSDSTIEECASIFMLKYERPKNQTEENQKVRQNYAKAFRDKYSVVASPTTVDKTKYIMSAAELVTKCNRLLTVPTLYVYGGLGGAMHDRNLQRYKGKYAKKENINGNMFGFDCVGMIKSLLWGFSFSTDVKYNYGGACVPSNNVPNTGARKFFNDYCYDISDDWKNIVVGEAVWLNGNPDSHIGIYVGDGAVIECSPKWENGVQKSYIKNMGCNNGHVRTWLKHGKIPWIDYSSVAKTDVIIKMETTQDKTTHVYYSVVKGDTLVGIAKKYGINDWHIIANNNGIEDPRKLKIGQKLLIK